MPTTVKRTIELSPEDASFLDEKLASGAYADDNEVISAGLDALRSDDERFERWLREEVVPELERLDADPSLVVSVDEVFAELWAHHHARIAAKP